MKFFTSIVFILVLSLNVNAQDWHFSQFYYSPLTRDPALTGNMGGTARVGLNYRNQWLEELRLTRKQNSTELSRTMLTQGVPEA